jgi:hypothetical protein
MQRARVIFTVCGEVGLLWDSAPSLPFLLKSILYLWRVAGGGEELAVEVGEFLLAVVEGDDLGGAHERKVLSFVRGSRRK